MTRTLWTLFAGFVLGIYSIFFAVVHVKAIRKPVIDIVAKVLVDWIYGARPDELRSGYRRTYATPVRRDYRDYSQMKRPVPQNQELTLDTHDETVQLLTTMQDMVDEFGQFTVADLKTACGRAISFDDHKYGWKSVEGVLYFDQRENTPGYIVTVKAPAIAL